MVVGIYTLLLLLLNLRLIIPYDVDLNRGKHIYKGRFEKPL